MNFSTFSVGDMEITLLTFDVSRKAWRERLADALAECDRALGLDSVMKQTFFLSPDACEKSVAAIAGKAYAGAMPVTSYVGQPPVNGSALSCELWAFSSPSAVQRSRHTSWVSTPCATWGFVGGTARPDGKDMTRMLRAAQEDLRAADLDFRNMVRTWYYIGDILGPAGHGSQYDQFNAARNGFYRGKWPDFCRTPASTGIGMARGRVVFDGLVVKPEAEDMEVAWLDNPLQTPPWLYNIQVEQGMKPCFSRGATVRLGQAALTFISGTAAIRESRVLRPDDAVAQTEITIENISALLGGAGMAGLRQARVYVRRAEDAARVLDCCAANLPDTPRVCTIADICKPDCLVEIEGVHFTADVPDEVPASDELAMTVAVPAD